MLPEGIWLNDVYWKTQIPATNERMIESIKKTNDARIDATNASKNPILRMVFNP